MITKAQLKEELPVVIIYLLFQIPLIIFLDFSLSLTVIIFSILLYQIYLAAFFFLIYVFRYNIEKKLRSEKWNKKN